MIERGDHNLDDSRAKDDDELIRQIVAAELFATSEGSNSGVAENDLPASEEAPVSLDQSLSGLAEKARQFQTLLAENAKRREALGKPNQANKPAVDFADDVISTLDRIVSEVQLLLAERDQAQAVIIQQEERLELNNQVLDRLTEIETRLERLAEQNQQPPIAAPEQTGITPITTSPLLTEEDQEAKPVKKPSASDTTEDATPQSSSSETKRGKRAAASRSWLDLVSGWLTVLILPLLVVVSLLSAGLAVLWRPSANNPANAASRIEKALGDLDEHRAQLNRIESGLRNQSNPTTAELPKGVIDRIDKSTKAVETVEKTAKDVNDKLTMLAKQMDELNEAVDTVKTGLPRDWDKHLDVLKKLPLAAATLANADAKFKNINDSLTEYKKQLKDILETIDKVKTQQEAGAKAVPKDLANRIDKLQQLADNKVNGLDARLEGFGKQLKDLQDAMAKVKTAGQPAEAQDVLIVALQTPEQDLNRYLKAYQEVFRDLPRDKDGAMRFGLVIGQTLGATERIKLTDEQINLTSFGKPNPNATEDPEAFGLELKKMFDVKRPRQRAILVASINCPLLRRHSPGWKDIAQVDVVLIQRHKDDKGASNLLSWHEFCRGQRGFVHVISPGDDQQQNDQLRDVLRQLCQARK